MWEQLWITIYAFLIGCLLFLVVIFLEIQYVSLVDDEGYTYRLEMILTLHCTTNQSTDHNNNTANQTKSNYQNREIM